MLHVYFGADGFECSEAVRHLEARLWSDPSLGQLNRTVLDGRRLTLAELRHHCDALPFLAERRLVIVEGLMTRLDGKGGEPADKGAREAEEPPDRSKALLDELLAYLPNLPPTTDLVLLDAGLEGRNSRGRIAQWAQTHGATVREFGKKRPEDLADWIRARVQQAGGKIEPRAVAELAQLVGDDTRTLAQEIEKLLLYVEKGRPITREDVIKLTPHSRQSNIFVIVDAIGERRWAQAVAELRRLLDEGTHPLSVLAMIARQYRLITMAKAWGAAGAPQAEVMRQLGVSEWQAKKFIAQAARYTPTQLRVIYDRLTATDLAIKTGELDAPVALELFVLGDEKAASR